MLTARVVPLHPVAPHTESVLDVAGAPYADALGSPGQIEECIPPLLHVA